MYKISPQLEFVRKLKKLDADELRKLFDTLKAEEANLGMLMAVSKEYAIRTKGAI